MKIAGRNFLLSGIVALVLIFTTKGLAISGEEASHDHSGTSQQMTSSAWEDALKAQLEREDAAEGRTGQREKVNAAMQKLMEEISKGTNEHAAHTGQGAFSEMGMMQQMDRSFFLGPTGVGETVTAGAATSPMVSGGC